MTPATMITLDGIEQPIAEWALDYGITPGIIIARLERGMSIGEAITTPMKVGFPGQQLPAFHRRQRVGTASKKARSVDGLTLTLKEWAAHLGMTYNSLCGAIHRFGSLEALIDHRRQRDQAPGVVSDFATALGTGGGGSYKRARI